MTGQTEEGSIKDRLYPCAHCGKKDMICVEARCGYIYNRPMKFYRIRCRRLMCRFKDLFDTHFDQSSDLDDLIKGWNGCYRAEEMGRSWRRIE